MADISKFLGNLASGALNPKGNLGDFAHGARLYVDDNFKFAPKQKFLYHVAFNINPDAAAIIPQLTQKHGNTINMLVKSVDLPKFDISTETKHAYNRKRVIQKRIDYSPSNIVFHDDNYGVTTALWEAYYRYYYKDGNYTAVDQAGSPEQTSAAYNRANIYGNETANQFRYGFDNDSYAPFFTSIILYQMSRKRYTAFTLVNPLIQSWQHDTMDQQSAGDPVQSSMSVEFETVWYSRGQVTKGSAPKGFATEHYDQTPSPLTLGGGGTSSLFGVGGVASGTADVFGDITSGDAFKSPASLLGTVLKAGNIAKNAKSLSSAGLRQEGFGILKGALGDISGASVGGVANSLFPKSGGSGGLSSIVNTVAGVSAVASIAGSLQGSSVADARAKLEANPDALDDLAKSTTFKKSHLAGGGLPDVNSINSAWNTASSSFKSAQRTATLNNLSNIVKGKA